jgi:hypothetical protein
MPCPQRPLADAIKEADVLAKSLNFPRKPNSVELRGGHAIDSAGHSSASSCIIESPYIDPIPALLTAIKQQGKQVRIKRIPHAELPEEPDLDISITRKDREGVYHISIAERCTFCVRRFAALKELLHVYFDILEHSSAVRELTDTLTAAIQSRRSVEAAGISGEAFCYVAAIEILIPYGEFRTEIANYRDVDQRTDYDIARMTRVPSSVIYFFFNKYITISDFIHRK